MIEQPSRSSFLPVVVSTEQSLEVIPPADAGALESGRRRALEIDRAMAELRATFREAAPPPVMPRPAPTGRRWRSAPIAPPRTREHDPAVDFRRLLLDGHEAFCRGRFADALAVYEQARRDAPARVAGYLGLARTLLALKRFSEARETYRQALDVEPENIAARDGLADCEWRMDLPAIEPDRPLTRRPKPRASIFRKPGRTNRAKQAN